MLFKVTMFSKQNINNLIKQNDAHKNTIIYKK